MDDERKGNELKLLTLDYFLIDRVREVLNQGINDHAKANLLCDIVKEEVERHISNAYDKGYEACKDEDGELEQLKEAMSEIFNIAASC